MEPPFTYNSFNLLHVMKKMILLAAAMAATLPGIAQTDTIQYRTFQGYLNPHERGTIHIPDILGYRTSRPTCTCTRIRATVEWLPISEFGKPIRRDWTL